MCTVLHVISNSHMDPVWLWKRRSGRATWCNTIHSVVRMMERHPELKFTCSSSAMYRWIEEHDPALFQKLVELVKAGRWELIGGWEVQSDAIIAQAEPLLRQGLVGAAYFREKFGVQVDTGYCVDSFGHGTGLPKLLNAAGLTKYVFMRPDDTQMVLPLLFDWKGDDGSCVRVLRLPDYYNLAGAGREQFIRRVVRHANAAPEHYPLFFGVGDHGGGLSERQLGWLHEAPVRCEVRFSTLKEYFEAASATTDIPVITGELGQVFRGIYSSCHEVKRLISVATNRILTAEKLGVSETALARPWQELLFHHFHDDLPGTCTREVYCDDVFPALGGVIHQANDLIDDVLFKRTAAADTTFMPEGGVYLRNTEPNAQTAIVRVTGFADPNENGTLFNALCDKDGTCYPVQLLPPPTTFGPCNLPWADLTAVVPMEANGERYLAWKALEPSCKEKLGFEKQRRILSRLSFRQFFDDSGTWGFTLTNYLHPLASAELVRTEEIADGPVCSVLRAVYKLNHSEIQADLWNYRDVPEIRIALRIDWQEPCATLKMGYAHGLEDHWFATGAAAGVVVRFQHGQPLRGKFFKDGVLRRMCARTNEVPMIDWCAAGAPNGDCAAFYSADLRSCDHADGEMRLTLLRTNRFADHHPFPPNDQTGFNDMGMTFMEAWLKLGEGTVETLPRMVHARLNNAECVEVTCHAAPEKNFNVEEPATIVTENPQVVTEAMRRVADTWEVHLMNYGDDTQVTLPDGRVSPLSAHALTIVTYPAAASR